VSRLGPVMARLRAAGRKALIPYITAGDPEPVATVPMMHALVEAGADVIELGVPFSDPMADGPVIQAACERALAHGTALHDVLDMVRRFRERDADTPVVLMGYLNPVEVMGYTTFARTAAAVGVDGVLTVDMPPEEAHELVRALRAHELDPIFLVAPTSDRRRIEAIAAAASGFLYYVSLKGVTGADALDVDAVARKLEEVRAVTDLPVGVGFGISDAARAAAVSVVADAVVVGSALVRRIAEHAQEPAAAREAVGGLLRAMRQAMDAAVHPAETARS